MESLRYVALCAVTLAACMPMQAATTAPTIDEASLANMLGTGDFRGAGFVRMNAAPFVSGLDPSAHVTMYVSNDAAAAYEGVSPDVDTSSGPPFPVGGVIVREAHDESGKVSMLTAMVKREAGYFPAVGDFFFGITDPEGKPMPSAWGKDGDCATCHETRAAAGYLFGVGLDVRAAGEAHVRNSD